MTRIETQDHLAAEPLAWGGMFVVFCVLAWLYGESCRKEGYAEGAAYERQCHAETRVN